MNKAEFVNAMAEQTGLSKKDSEAAINAFVNIVSDVGLTHNFSSNFSPPASVTQATSGANPST